MRALRSKAARWCGLPTLLVVGLLCAGPARAGDLTMLAHAPATASAHPTLIVLLHGAGADERDMIGLWRDLPPTAAVVSPRAPFGDGRGGWRWYRKGPTQDSDIATSRKIIDLVVDAAIKRFDVDPTKVFVGGFSQGGVMTYEMALHEPGKFRGAMVFSGSLFPSALAGDPSAPKPPPFFIAHGTMDGRIPFAAATKARAELEARHVAVTFDAVDGLGHSTTPAEIEAASRWLAGQLDEPVKAP